MKKSSLCTVKKAARRVAAKKARSLLVAFGINKELVDMIYAPTQRQLAGALQNEFDQLDRSVEPGLNRAIRRAVLGTIEQVLEKIEDVGRERPIVFVWRLRAAYHQLSQVNEICTAVCDYIENINPDE